MCNFCDESHTAYVSWKSPNKEQFDKELCGACLKRYQIQSLGDLKCFVCEATKLGVGHLFGGEKAVCSRCSIKREKLKTPEPEEETDVPMVVPRI